jgi:plastocyanin
LNPGPHRNARVLVLTQLACLLLLAPFALSGQDIAVHSGHRGHQMAIDPDGFVMNENHDKIPRDCSGIGKKYAFTIHAGRKYADGVPGMVFGMSQYEVRVAACSLLEITFVNEDSVRHQWMVHGLPKYLYPAGMFHIEVSGGHSKTGTFIVPGENQTYLIHCDMAQHMEKGMRGQLVVGKGSGNLWGIVGVSDQFYRFSYLPPSSFLLASLVLVLSFLLALKHSKRP